MYSKYISTREKASSDQRYMQVVSTFKDHSCVFVSLLQKDIVPDWEADGEEEDDGGGQVEAEDDHTALVHWHPGEVLSLAEAHPGYHGHRVYLPDQWEANIDQ